MLNERRQTQESTYFMIPFKCNSRKVIYSERKQISGCLGKGIEGGRGYKGMRDDGNVGYLDCGNGFTYMYICPKLIKLYTLNM